MTKLKAVLGTVIVAGLVAGNASAFQVNWGTTGPTAIVGPGGEVSGMVGWVIKMYDSTQGADLSALTWDDILAATPIDVNRPMTPSTADDYGTVGFDTPGGGRFTAVTDVGTAADRYVYSVVFNTTDADLSNHNDMNTDYWVILDGDAPTKLGAMTGSSAAQTYDTTGAEQGDWQAVPEPSTMALFGLGLAALVAKRMKKKN